MRLTYLCDIELVSEGTPTLARPYGGEEGTGFGEGSGRVSGERLSGTLRFANYPHRRSDGVMLPDLRGAIATKDGASILFTMRGRTAFRRTDQGPLGCQMVWTLFETEDQRYRWLNDELCVMEGKVVVEQGRPVMVGRARVYVCENELL